MNELPGSPSLRLWPGIVLAGTQLLLWLVMPLLVEGGAMLAVLGGAALGLLVLVWWLAFSRAPWLERFAVLALMIAAVAATRLVVDRSISNGMMGMMLLIYSITPLSLALVAGAVISRGRPAAMRWATIAAAVVLACSAFTLLRTDGITGAGVSQLHWRWTPTAEERLLAESGPVAITPTPVDPTQSAPAPATPIAQAPAAAPATTPGKNAETPAVAAPAAIAPAEWPGFRGPNRNAVVRDLRVDTDWTSHPPAELWRRAVGPGWSSFAVKGDLIYTQEQRGDNELISCYRFGSGAPVWTHADSVRFYESNGGAGPRGTPTVHGDRVYAFGATGIVNALDAATGRRIWSRNAATDTRRSIPGWGFSSSPLVVDGVVVIGVSGQLIAYDAATGEPRWTSPARGGGYSSPHLATIGGVTQIVFQTGAGAIGVSPADGTVLWEHLWETGVAIVQPAFVDGDVLVSGGDSMGGVGIRRLAVSRGPGGWSAEPRWSTRGLKPYFNDMVVHEGHAYGFDGTILAAIDLNDGTRKWKGGRYGAGQMILLPEQDLLLVLAEEGALALVKASPDGFTEIARTPAIEGKTWNHPALVGGVLLVRNGEEMAAFKLAAATSQSPRSETTGSTRDARRAGR